MSAQQRKTVHGDFRPGDRVRYKDDGFVGYVVHALIDFPGDGKTVAGTWYQVAGPQWPEPTNEYYLAESVTPSEIELVARPVYMTPERIEALRFAFNAAMRQLSDACAALGKDFPDLQAWRDHVTLCEEMLAEAKG